MIDLEKFSKGDIIIDNIKILSVSWGAYIVNVTEYSIFVKYYKIEIMDFEDDVYEIPINNIMLDRIFLFKMLYEII